MQPYKDVRAVHSDAPVTASNQRLNCSLSWQYFFSLSLSFLWANDVPRRIFGIENILFSTLLRGLKERLIFNLVGISREKLAKKKTPSVCISSAPINGKLLIIASLHGLKFYFLLFNLELYVMHQL